MGNTSTQKRKRPSSVKGGTKKKAKRGSGGSPPRTPKHYGATKRFGKRNDGTYASVGFYKSKRKKWARDSIVIRAEQGGIIEDNECLYVGHGLPVEKMFRSAVAAMLKKGFDSRGGYDIQDPLRDLVFDSGDTEFTSHALIFEYFKDAEDKGTYSFTVSLAVTDTLMGIADKVILGMYTAFNALPLADTEIPKFVRVRQVDTDSVGTMKKYNWSLNLQYFNIYIDHVSYLKFQNITKPGSTIGATGEDPESSGNIEAVTMNGRIYKTEKWKNCFVLARRSPGTNANDKGLMVDPLGGFISQTATNMATADNDFRKPPYPYQLGVRKFNKVHIPSGKIFRDKYKFRTKIGFNTLIEKLLNGIRNNVALDTTKFHIELDIGGAHVLALEKMMDFRTDDWKVTIGYEVDYTLKVSATAKKPPTRPIIELWVPKAPY